MYTWHIVKNGINHQDDLQMTETETHASSAVPLHLTPEGRSQIHQPCLLSEMMFPSLIQAAIQCYYSLLQAHRLLFQRVREDFICIFFSELFSLALLKRLIYMKSIVTEKDRRETFHPRLHFPAHLVCQVWAEPKPGANSSILLTHMGGGNLSIWAFIHRFLDMLAGNRAGSRAAGP